MLEVTCREKVHTNKKARDSKQWKSVKVDGGYVQGLSSVSDSPDSPLLRGDQGEKQHVAFAIFVEQKKEPDIYLHTL